VTVGLREVAWHVTARELESALEEEKGVGERAASYLISPFGARMNRVLLAGSLSPAEAVGRDEAAAFWRARLSDPTGAVGVTAGSFQPRAMAQLRAVDRPRLALVVGKAHLFRGRDGIGIVSVRAEGVRTLSETEERGLLADVVRQTVDRLDLLERLEQGPASTEEALRAEGVPGVWVRAARESLRRYPQVDRSAFRRELGPAVRRVAGDSGPVVRPEGPPPTVRVTRAPAATPPPAAPSPEERQAEALFLDLVDEAADLSADGYADLKDVLERGAARGLATTRAEEALNRLEEGGVLEEPIVGKLRRA
jgi:uncharacterized protein